MPVYVPKFTAETVGQNADKRFQGKCDLQKYERPDHDVDAVLNDLETAGRSRGTI